MTDARAHAAFTAIANHTPAGGAERARPTRRNTTAQLVRNTPIPIRNGSDGPRRVVNQAAATT